MISTMTELPASECVYCGARHDAASAVGDVGRPKPGDVTVCIKCGGLLAFDDRMLLRKAEDSELENFDYGTRQQIAKVREAIRVLNDRPRQW